MSSGFNFSSARGGGSPFLNLIAGLGAGLDGYMRGRDFRDQEQMQQQNIQNQKLSNASGLLGLFQNLARSGALPNNPQNLQAINSGISPLGITLDQSALGTMGRISPADLINNPKALEGLQELSPDVRAIFKNYVSGLPDTFWSGAARPSPDEAAREYNDLRMAYQPYLMGWGDPNSADAQQIRARMQYISQFMPGAAQAPGAPQANPSAPVRQGSRLSATVNSLNAGTGEKRAQTNLLNKKASWYDQMAEAQVNNWHALTNLHNMQTWAVPKDVQARLTSADAAASRADDDTTRTNMALQSFQKLGVTPQALQSYNGLMTSMQGNANQQRAAIQSIQQSIDSILRATNGANPKPGSVAAQQLDLLRSALEHHNAQYNTTTTTLQKFEQGRAAFAKRVYKNLGLPSNYNLTNAPHAHPGQSAPKGALFSPDGKQYWYQGHIYDAQTGRRMK